MAVIYVRSTDGSDSDNGSTWALAKATLAGALAIAVAGDTVWVSDNHAETQGSAMTLNSAGTLANPVKVLCGDDAAEPPTALATTATVSTTGAFAITFQSATGCAYYYGITFQAGSSSSTANLNVCASTNNVESAVIMEACVLKLNNTSTSSLITFGGNVASILPRSPYVELINTVLTFGATGQAIQQLYAKLLWRDTPSALGGATFPTTLFVGGTSMRPGISVVIAGVDLSALGSGKTLFERANYAGDILLRNCKLGASVTIASGTSASQAAREIIMDICDSSGTTYRMEHYKYQGSIVNENTIKCTSPSATDGVTAISWKMAALATGPSFVSPLVSPPIFVWSEFTTSITVQIEIVHDSLTALKDNEVWIDLEYLGSSGSPITTLVSDRVASLVATAADQSVSFASWTTTGLTNPNTQKLGVTFVPALRGLIRATVKLALPSKTIYVCPKLTII